jgi:5'-nucleotidase
MKYAFTSILTAAVLVAVGCANNNKPAPTASGSVADISPMPPPPTPTYQPAPLPIQPAQPASYEASAAATAMPAFNDQATGGAGYKVRRGDTLYSIARARYGDGKQWQRIAAANPGISPSSLKVGQVLTIP